MNPTAIGTLMDNEFQHQVDEDLNDNSNEPATKGDVRNLALRVELRIMKSESALIERISEVRDQLDIRITETSERLGNRVTETNEQLGNRITETNERISTTNERITSLESSLKDYMYATGWKFFGATIGTMGAMFTVLGIFINSSMK
jgi:flagellar capping protein FliD